MSKMLESTCESQVVSVGEVTVAADILSQGNKASAGVVILDVDKAKYVTSNASDIRDLIVSLVTIINQIVTIATGLDGVTNSPGAQATNIAQLTTLKTNLDNTKDMLK